MTDTKHTKREYDKFAKEYHEHLLNPERNKWHKHVEKPYLLKLLKDKIKNKTVLDLGCGSGIFTKDLLKFKPKKLIGLDLSEGLINIAKREYPSIEFYQGDAKKTNFGKQEFDLIFSSLMVHYFDNLLPLFKEVSRILKTKGEFIFSMHHPVMEVTSRLEIDGKKHKSKLILQNYFKEEKYSWKLGEKMKNMIAYHHNFETIINSLAKTGFIVEELFETRPKKVLEKISEKDYERSNNKPSFIVVKARKVR